MGDFNMYKELKYTIEDEIFTLKMDGLHVHLSSVCTTYKGNTYKHIMDYKAKNEPKAQQMFSLLLDGEVFLDGGIVRD
jgi:hypothetical protein